MLKILRDSLIITSISVLIMLALPILKSNLVPWYWASLDFLEKRYQRNNPWKKVGKKCAADPAVLTSK